MLRTDPKVSLIIPVYNVESYLRRCFDSVEAQEYKNIEVIIVNDGSTDGSLAICREYAEKFPDWQLIDQENAGLSGARNSGLDAAAGDYIAFLDSDDWLDSGFISDLVGAALKYDADIVESGVRWIYPSEEREQSFGCDRVLDRHAALSEYLLQTTPIHSAVWCKLYRRELFDGVRFAVGRLHEDGFIMYRLMYGCNKYALISRVGYNYLQNRKGSIMSASVKPKNIIDVTDMMEERIAFFEEKGESELAEKAKSYHYRTMLTNYAAAQCAAKDPELAEMIKNKLSECRKEIMRNKYLGLKKLKFIAFFFFPPLFRYKYMRER